MQNTLRERLILQGNLSGVDLVAGADTSSPALLPPRFRGGSMGGEPDIISAAVVIWCRSLSKIIASATASIPALFPYVHGLLAFRELPALLESFARLSVRPDVIIVDGQGTAHPRRFGIACHLGLELSLPSVGCGKSRLCGYYDEPADERGAESPLWDNKHSETKFEIGRVLRTRTGVKPLFISPGHLCDADNAVRLVLDCCKRYRLPEPIRAAHHLAGETRKSNLKSQG